jgi:hypothetical protein
VEPKVDIVMPAALATPDRVQDMQGPLVSQAQIDNAIEVLTWAHDDPSRIGWPPMLAIELAMGEASVKDICEAYGVTRDRFAQLVKLPGFVKQYEDAKKMLQTEGMSFRAKARLQAEEYLKTSWAIVHNPNTPSAVKADLIKQTWRVAGLEPKEGASVGSAMQININLG